MTDDARPLPGDAGDSLAEHAERTTESRARAFESGLSWHLHRLGRTVDAGRRDLEYAAAARRERITRSPKPEIVGVEQIQPMLAKLRAQARRTRAGVVAAIVVAVAAGGGLYFGSPQNSGGGGRAQSRPSVDWRAPSSLGSTSNPSEVTPSSEPAPGSASASASAPDPSAPPGTSVGRRQGAAPASSSPATSGQASPTAPGTSPPGTGPPPTTSPQNPLCQLSPALC